MIAFFVSVPILLTALILAVNILPNFHPNSIESKRNLGLILKSLETGDAKYCDEIRGGMNVRDVEETLRIENEEFQKSLPTGIAVSRSTPLAVYLRIDLTDEKAIKEKCYRNSVSKRDSDRNKAIIAEAVNNRDVSICDNIVGGLLDYSDKSLSGNQDGYTYKLKEPSAFSSETGAKQICEKEVRIARDNIPERK